MASVRLIAFVTVALLGVLSARADIIEPFNGWLQRYGGHNIIMCPPLPNDKTEFEPLLKQRVVVRGGFFRIKTESLVFPLSGAPTKVIQCVKIIDRMSDGRGGYASIDRGGLGSQYILITLRSQLSQGFDFDVEIYGHKTVQP